jgi:AraC-like DNA-binding protein
LDTDVNDENGDSAFSFILSYITEVLGSVSFDENTTLFCEVRGYIACIISYPGEETGEGEQRLKGIEYAKRIAEKIRKRFGIDIYVGISDIYYSPAGLQHAYTEAAEIIEYATLTGEKNKILDSTLLPFEDTSAADSLRTMTGNQTMLINCLRLGNYENAREIFNDRLLLPLKKNRSGARSSRLKLELLRDVLLEAFYEIRGLLPEEEWQKLKVDKRIYEAASIDAISESVNLILDDLIKAADSADANAIREKDDRLLSYVNTHFTDPNINILQLAEMHGMSTSYFSKSFKRVAGVGLLDYIHSLRIQRAKILLETTDKSINAVAAEVGYTNSLTMIRAFKRYEGITPSEYKKIASS